MATMGGGSVAAPVLDPDDEPSVKNEEIIWHLIERVHYKDDPNSPGTKRISSASFSSGKSGVSFVRRANPKIDLQYVQARFPGCGIAQFTVAQVRAVGCIFAIEQDAQWPQDAHICAYKAPGKGRIQGGKVSALVKLATANLIVTPSP
jgi:hypothetical protein